VLSPLAGLFNREAHPGLLVGMSVADDAAVYRINAKTAVVATLDFFAPIVDDAFTYGAIAAANAMSDVFAMGGEVVLALNVAAFPEDLPSATMSDILRGGAEKVAEAGGVVAGGHTVWDKEPKFGLSVLGTAHPNKLMTKAGLKPGDVLYLTKPLGTGSLVSCYRNGRAESEWMDAAIQSMLTLNRHASHLAVAAGVRAGTDVTGFGLIGHLWEMCERSGVAANVQLEALPLLPGALEASAMGFHTGGEGRNRDHTSPHVAVTDGLDPDRLPLAWDPQTSGGLLLGLSKRRAPKLEAAFARDALPLWRIGSITDGPPQIRITG
jgi:selenide, water dikinase